MDDKLLNDMANSITRDAFDGSWDILACRIADAIVALTDISKSPHSINAMSDGPILIAKVIDDLGTPQIANPLQAKIWNMSAHPLHRALSEAWLSAHPDEDQSSRSFYEEVLKGFGFGPAPASPDFVLRFSAFRDDEAGVWVAISDSKITTEAETKEGLLKRLAEIVPDVLKSRTGGASFRSKIVVKWEGNSASDASETTLEVA